MREVTSRRIEPASEPALRVRDLPDAAVQASLQDWLEIECQQIDAGAFHGRIVQLALGNLEVCGEQHDRTVYKQGWIPTDRCTVSVSLRTDPSLRFMEFAMDEDCPLFFLPGGTEFDVYVPGGLSTLYVAFDQQEMLAGLRALGPAAWDVAPTRLLSLGVAGRPAFIQTLQAVLELGRHGAVTDAASLRRNLMHDVLLAVTAGTPPHPGDVPSLRTRQRRLHLVREAQDYARACFAAYTTPTVVDICAHLGVSERTLEYSFRDLLQITPVTYLRIRRLNRVRRALLEPAHAGVTVTQVAVRHGFLHLGKFGQDYRRHFGETPSATLGRALR